MSLYNMLFGENKIAPILLAILDIEIEEIPRYRDIFWDGENIVIHTRTGGGNREEYFGSNNRLTQIEGYIRDDDDDFDETYANFYYQLPSKFSYLRSWLNNQSSPPPSELWKDLIFKLDSGNDLDPHVQKALEFGKELSEKIKTKINK